PPRIVRGRFGSRMIEPPRTGPQPQGKNAPKGLNENYGRELMELHTLGVDGGYTQKDVTEVARAFTGWTIDKPRQGGGFRFEPRIHDQGQKIVLGHVIKAGGGQSDGEQVLDLLARHPSTARFIATKLVRRFVSDTPPAPLVDRADELRSATCRQQTEWRRRGAAAASRCGDAPRFDARRRCVRCHAVDDRKSDDARADGGVDARFTGVSAEIT